MKKLLFLLLFATAAHASDRITASITVTNATTNGMTFTVNGSTRTFTNVVFTPSTQVLTNDDVNGVGSKSNLFNQIALNPFSPQIIQVSTGTNSFTLSAACGGALTVTASAGYASVTYSTQSCTSATSVLSPFSTYPSAATRTNTASQIVTDLNTYSTTPIDQTATIAAQLVGTNNAQTINGAKLFTSASTAIQGGSVVGAASIGGAVSNLTGGVWTNGVARNVVSSNLVNIGGALSSRGSGTGAEQFGDGAIASGNTAFAAGGVATATADATTAVGNSANAAATSATALGQGSTASGILSMAGGVASTASGYRSIAWGGASTATASNSMALGAFADSEFTNSTAIGTGATNTANDQVMLGSLTSSTVVPRALSVGSALIVSGNANISGFVTNLTATGTNNFPPGSDIAFGRFAISSLANGNNAGVTVGTNVFVSLSGPTGAFTINGIAGGRDGKLVILYNGTGQDMTIAHQSGTDPTAANRIITMTGADETTTGNGTAILIYDGSASRWLLISLKL